MQTRSDELKNLMAALLEVQKALPSAQTNRQNSHLKSKYADLVAVQAVCRPLLVEHSLAITHTSTTAENGSVTVTALMVHAPTGEWLTSSVTITPQQNTPQGVGSAMTYGRRYTLAALVGIVVDDDDDGHAASAPVKGAKPDELTSKKLLIKQTLKVYRGEDKDDIRGECLQLEANEGWTLKYADAILKRLTKEPLT